MYRVTHEAMTNHNTTFLNTFRAIMVGIFGPAADAQFGTTEGPIGPTYFNPPKQSSGDIGTSGLVMAPEKKETMVRVISRKVHQNRM